MNMPIQAVAVPLFEDGQGGLRVTGTRVLLERIVHAFEDGATPKGIVQSYDTLQLADVYAVLTWYLRHKADVEDYLRKRAEEAEAIRRTIEAKQPDRAELRARLMARRAQKEVVHAPRGELRELQRRHCPRIVAPTPPTPACPRASCWPHAEGRLRHPGVGR